MLHGLLAAMALGLLLYAYLADGVPAVAAWALLAFLVAGWAAHTSTCATT
jgi:hypothetical protein